MNGAPPFGKLRTGFDKLRANGNKCHHFSMLNNY